MFLLTNFGGEEDRNPRVDTGSAPQRGPQRGARWRRKRNTHTRWCELKSTAGNVQNGRRRGWTQHLASCEFLFPTFEARGIWVLALLLSLTQLTEVLSTLTCGWRGQWLLFPRCAGLPQSSLNTRSIVLIVR